MLAAGRGRRLGGDNDTHAPKALLRFDGKTLLARHLETLKALNVADLTLVVGYRRDDILAELARAAAPGFVRTVVNPDFHEGSNLSLAKAGDTLASGATVLFMDADVLYHPDMIRRLLASAHESCLLLDRDIEAGEDPVKICQYNGTLVDFGKIVHAKYDQVGEWPGFARFSPRLAARLGAAVAKLVATGRRDAPYEDAMRDVFLSEPPGTVGVEDITDLPWIEIDFPSDLERARTTVMPRIAAMTSSPVRG